MDNWNANQLQQLISAVDKTIGDLAISYAHEDAGSHALDVRVIDKTQGAVRSPVDTSFTAWFQKNVRVLLLANLQQVVVSTRPAYLPSAPGDPALTEREIEILRCSAEGMTAADISDRLSLKKRTVDFHINNAVRKMGAINKTAAVAQAVWSGVL